MLDIQIGDVATWASVLVAALAIWHAARSAKDAEKSQVEALQHQREAAKCQQEAASAAEKNAQLLAKQHQLELRQWTDQYFVSVREWADEVCSTISEALHMVSDPTQLESRRFNTLVRLSSLIDTGRWYFPNQWKDDYGTHKEPAYRGIRQEVLDCVVAAYGELEKLNPSAEVAKSRLVKCQREFVSHIQAVLDPRARADEIAKVLSEFEQSERLRNAPGAR